MVSHGKNCVMAKLALERMISMETIQTHLKRWWKLFGTLSYSVIDENLFLIEFTDTRDKECVLDGRQWVFEGNLLLVEDFDENTFPLDYTFDKVVFWVRMINLLLGCMGQAIGKRIGETADRVEMVDVGVNGIGWSKFLQVKILLELNKLLPKGRKINIQGKSVWVTFQYERLPKFCYACGIISHEKTGCPLKSSLRH